MREYLSLDNFKKAVFLAAPVSAMAILRFREGGLDPVFLLVAGFLVMTLAAGAVMAWGRSGGMVGAFPAPRRMWIGAGAAAVVAAAGWPVNVFFLQPWLRPAIEATGDELLVTLRYPDTFPGRVGLMLWSAGFETLIFPGAAMCFLARLTGKVGLAAVGTVALRALLLSQQLTEAGVVSAVPLFLISTALSCAIGCVLFARAGLPAAMVYAAGVDLHLWL